MTLPQPFKTFMPTSEAILAANEILLSAKEKEEKNFSSFFMLAFFVKMRHNKKDIHIY